MDYRIIEKEIFYRDKRIYGLLYQPNKEKFPLLIISHGLGGSYQGSQDFEECFAENGIGVFAVSTYNTDYVLVKAEDFARAADALSAAGYEVRQSSGTGKEDTP